MSELQAEQINVLTTQLAEAKADLARVTAERDRLIERWGTGNAPVKSDDSEEWWVANGDDPRGKWFPTRTPAVRFAAGLDEAE